MVQKRDDLILSPWLVSPPATDLDGLGRPSAAGVDAIKAVDIQAQKTAGYPFWGRTLLPRSFTLSVGYKF
jgi:hypothetical protein